METLNLNSEQEIIELIKLAEKNQRYEDVSKFYKIYIKKFNQKNLSIQQRNSVVEAYQQLTLPQRNAIKSLSEDINLADSPEIVKIIQKYIEVIAAQVKVTILEFIDLLKFDLINTAMINNQSENQVFYLKLYADYLRYLIEIAKLREISDTTHGNSKETQELKNNINTCLDIYQQANKIADEDLSAIDLVKLDLGLNYSLFLFKILGRKQEAVAIAKSSCESAVTKLATLSIQESEKSLIESMMAQIKHNLIDWEQ